MPMIGLVCLPISYQIVEFRLVLVGHILLHGGFRRFFSGILNMLSLLWGDLFLTVLQLGNFDSAISHFRKENVELLMQPLLKVSDGCLQILILLSESQIFLSELLGRSLFDIELYSELVFILDEATRTLICILILFYTS